MTKGADVRGMAWSSWSGTRFEDPASGALFPSERNAENRLDLRDGADLFAVAVVSTGIEHDHDHQQAEDEGDSEHGER